MENPFKLNYDTKRIFGLDILRAIAIMFVIFEHGKFIPYAPLKKFPIFDGVSIFFVLSGFLIGTILIKTIEKSEVNLISLINFWIMRWFRTLPLYLLILTILVVIKHFHIDGFHFPLRYYLFLQNFNSQQTYFFLESWSLSVEEWFYIIIPIIVFSAVTLFKTKPKTLILIISLTVIILVTGTRYFYYLSLNGAELSFGNWDFLFRRLVVTRLDSIMYGVVGAYFFYYHLQFFNKNKNLFLVLGLVLITIHKTTFSPAFIGHMNLGFNNLYYTIFSFSLISMGVLLIIPFLNNIKTGSGIFYQIVTYISLISYSLYLINFSIIIEKVMPFFYMYLKAFDLPTAGAIAYIVYWTLSIAVSILLFKYFELPVQSLRKKFLIKTESNQVQSTKGITMFFTTKARGHKAG